MRLAFDPRSQSVVFRTAEGTKLHGLLSAKQAAFETDGIEPGGRRIVGVAEQRDPQPDHNLIQAEA